MQTNQDQNLRAPKIKKIRKESLTSTGGAHLPPSLRKHLKKSASKTESASKG